MDQSEREPVIRYEKSSQLAWRGRKRGATPALLLIPALRRAGFSIWGHHVPFSKSVLKVAWLRAEDRCECTRVGHGHVQRCQMRLRFAERGSEAPWGWEARRRHEDRADTLSNCEILCQSCYRAVDGA